MFFIYYVNFFGLYNHLYKLKKMKFFNHDKYIMINIIYRDKQDESIWNDSSRFNKIYDKI
jgi:hypothetical protein